MDSSSDSLSATRDRPLFSVSRRPPFVTAAIVAPPPKQEAPPPPPPERPSLTLIGTIVSPKASVAILQGSTAKLVSRLRVRRKRMTAGGCAGISLALNCCRERHSVGTAGPAQNQRQGGRNDTPNAGDIPAELQAQVERYDAFEKPPGARAPSLPSAVCAIITILRSLQIWLHER